MLLTRVRVRNFRCIKDLSVDLAETTVLVGENNTGKTAFLDAIRICLSQLRARSGRVFHEYDYHLQDDEATPAGADPIVIELFFEEPEPDSWHEDIVRELVNVAVLGDDDRYVVTFRLRSGFDKNSNDFTSDWSFLDAQGNPLTGPAASGAQLSTLQRLAPVFYLSALRDTTTHFAPRGRYWRNFLSDASIPESDREQLEQAFSDLNDRLIAAHQPLNEVRSRLEDAKRVIDFGAGDAVGIDALPTKLFSLLSRTQVSLASPSGAKIPVDRQGEGTQSLAVLLLFGAFLRSRLSDVDRIAQPITALEEPEAHLHPSAVRSLMHVVGDLPGQKLVSSHSGELLASVDPLSVRRFVRRGSGIDVHGIQAETLNPDEMRNSTSTCGGAEVSCCSQDVGCWSKVRRRPFCSQEWPMRWASTWSVRAFVSCSSGRATSGCSARSRTSWAFRGMASSTTTAAQGSTGTRRGRSSGMRRRRTG